MTISSTTRKAGPFTGNGVTVAFPFAFKVFSAADLLVVQAVTATNVETVKVLYADYAVTLNTDQDNYPGGTVTMLTSPAVGTSLTLASQVGYLQPVDLTNNGGFYPKVINDAFDRVTIQIQQVAEQVSRAFKVSISSSSAGNTIFDYMNAAAVSAVLSATSATSSDAYAAKSSAFALNSSLSASAAAASAGAAAASASTATTPTASALALYLDAFQMTAAITFTAMYQAGGWDLGGLAAASPFPNENALRRTMLSAGGGSFAFGTVP